MSLVGNIIFVMFLFCLVYGRLDVGAVNSYIRAVMSRQSDNQPARLTKRLISGIQDKEMFQRKITK